MTIKKMVSSKIERREEITVSELYERCFGFVPTYSQAQDFCDKFVNSNKDLIIRHGCYPMLVSKKIRNKFLQWIIDRM